MEMWPKLRLEKPLSIKPSATLHSFEDNKNTFKIYPLP